MLSTMLYSALMIMEIIAGSAIEKISGPIFAVPILFCCSKFTLLRQTNRVRYAVSDAVGDLLLLMYSVRHYPA